MNIILVLIDSLNRHDLTAYGPATAATPNLDSFARRSCRFDNHFVGSLPCMPARREIFAGRKEFLWRPWGPLEPFDLRLPHLLEGDGYTTAIVTDHYHYWEESANRYMQSFQSARLVRGHEIDYWQPPAPADTDLPRWVQKIEQWRPGMARQYYANVKNFSKEEDFFPAKVMTEASHWLEEHAANGKFFLQVESFDVHEPFDVPEPYASMYADGKKKDEFNIWPPYQDVDRLAAFMDSTTSEELNFIRSQYLGKLTMVDRWFGELLDTITRLGLWDETAVIVTTDHGHDLGERGGFGKQYPHFDSHANIPLMVWHPSVSGTPNNVSALTSTVDVFATVLDICGIADPGSPHSRSLLPLLNGVDDNSRRGVVYGTFGEGVCVTDGEWTLFKSPERQEGLNLYSSSIYRSLVMKGLSRPIDSGHFIPDVELSQWKIPVDVVPRTREDFLFHREHDPKQNENVWFEEAEQRERMLALLEALIDEEGAPAEQWSRLGLHRSPSAA